MKNLNLVITNAMEQDPSIACYRDDAHTHEGTSLERLKELGLEKRHLKLLERHGMAVRGRSAEKSGHKIKWIIVIPRSV